MAASHSRNPSYPSLTSPAKTQNQKDVDNVLEILHERYNFPMPSERAGELPYVGKLGSLAKSDPERIYNALDALETMSNKPGKIWKGKGNMETLMTKFDKILERELSTSMDFLSDRDTSLLSLMNWDKYQATSSHGRSSSLSGSLGKLLLNEDEAKETVTDIDSDGDSFHSCSETPPPSNRAQAQDASSFSGSSLNTSGSGSFNQTFQRPQRMEGVYPSSGTLQRTSYLRWSGLGGAGGHRPQRSMQTVGTAPRMHHTSGSLNRIGKDYSLPKNPNASLDETQTVRGSASNSGTRAPRLSTVGPEEIYNGDIYGGTTDIDDVKIEPVTPRNLSSMHTGNNEPPLIRPLPNDGSEHIGIHASEKDDDEDEIAFWKRADEFFEEDSVSYPNSPLLSSATSSNRGGNLTIDEDEEKTFDETYLLADTATTTRHQGGEEVRGEEVLFVTPGGGHTVSSDDYDEDYGTIDISSEDEVMNHPALGPATAHPLPTLHFAVQWEATRVALHLGIQSKNSVICAYLNGFCDDLFSAGEYRDVWKTLTGSSKDAKDLERTDEAVWASLKHKSGWPDNAYLTGSVQFGALETGPESKIPLHITLNPLLKTRGNRFFNRFGSDRFLTLRLPSFQRLSNDASEKARARITDWLVEEELELLNRRWKCFFIKDRKTKKKIDIEKSPNQAIFFATEGVGIGENLDDQELKALGFRNDNRKLRHIMSAQKLLEWHIPLQGKNLNEKVSKFWSRISLGFSDGTPTVTVNPSMIEFINGYRSPIGEVMDDGCSVISPALMKMVRQKLGSNSTPTAVQARIGGAKGIWMVDPDGDWNSEELYIKVTTDSQLKYEGHKNDNDWARLTLDVLASSHDPTPASINTQLIPILTGRGVPFSVMKELLEEHLEGDQNELFQILDEPAQLRKWLYDRGGMAKERIRSNTVATCGALPANAQEITILLLESGFSVRECKYLRELVRKYIDQHCANLKHKLHIRIPHSTRLYCVADPTCTLEEGEVSLRFSKGILDPKTMRRTTVILGDILVAREPAHLPSDIQKVKAVDYHSPRLRELQDVIVFSVKGNKSLASLLSGGDYDGDKPWVCWDERVVEPFRNSDSTFDEYHLLVEEEFEKSDERMEDLEPHTPGFYDRFLRIGIANSLRENLLGHFTSVWDKVCYQNGISDPQAIRIAIMCSFLVDAPKQGLFIRSSTKEEIAKLSKRFKRPAYKNPQNTGDILKKSTNVIDRLHFVAEQKVTEIMTTFHNDIDETEKHEVMLTKLYNNEKELAQGEGGKPLKETLSHMITQFQRLYDSRSASQQCEFKTMISNYYNQFREIMPPKDLLKDPVISRLALNANSHLSYWSLLRASTAYFVWHNKPYPDFVWLMAGRELCFIKSQEMGGKSEFGPRTMVEEMYIPLKTIGRYQKIKKMDHDDDDDEEEEEGENYL